MGEEREPSWFEKPSTTLAVAALWWVTAGATLWDDDPPRSTFGNVVGVLMAASALIWTVLGLLRLRRRRSRTSDGRREDEDP